MRAGPARFLAPAFAVALTLVATLTAGVSAGAASPRPWWTPSPRVAGWQWELDHPLNLASATDLGTNARTPTGQRAVSPDVYDIDGLENPASTVAALHARGAKVICYIEVGAAETYRPDYRAFPTAALGRAMPGYSAERYLDIRSSAVRTVIEARVAMCARKGFDAVEPDIDDSYTDRTGFPITEAENMGYDRTLAGYAHGLGLAWGLKNGDADPEFSTGLVATSDFLVDEQCFQYHTCAVARPFLAAGKAVFEVEYDLPTSAFCAQAVARGIDSQRMPVALNGLRWPCR